MRAGDGRRGCPRPRSGEGEVRGIPTVSIAVARDVAETIRAPRAVFVPWPMGHHFGVPFHTAIQNRVLDEALDLVITATESGEIRELPIKWAKVRREAKHLSRQGRTL